MYPAENKSVRIAEVGGGKGLAALGDYCGGLGKCHACVIFRDRVRNIVLLWVQAFNKVLHCPSKVTEYKARIARQVEGWDLF